MRVSDKAIILQAIKHGDHKYILKLFTSTHGLISVAAIAGRKAGSKVRPGSISPLNLVDVELVLKQNQELGQLQEANCYFVGQGFTKDLSKLSIAQFLNEVLIKSLKEQGPNPELFDFVEHGFIFLNEAESDFINLHLYFLTELTKYLGFEPQNNYSKNEPYFDCRDGRFSPAALAFPLGLNAEESALFSDFLQRNDLKIKLKAGDRARLLDILLAYYRLHVPGFNEIKSLEVLREITRT